MEREEEEKNNFKVENLKNTTSSQVINVNFNSDNLY